MVMADSRRGVILMGYILENKDESYNIASRRFWCDLARRFATKRAFPFIKRIYSLWLSTCLLILVSNSFRDVV